jgi:hypothetical protein
MGTVRVFMSFDPLHDEDLKARLLEEAAHSCSGFEILACSEVAEMSDAWFARARHRIGASDEVIVICGEHTEDSRQVAAEVEIAQAAQKPYFLLWGRRDVMCKKPLGARASDGMYSWTPAILREQVALTLRLARPLEVPEQYKRR